MLSKTLIFEEVIETSKKNIETPKNRVGVYFPQLRLNPAAQAAALGVPNAVILIRGSDHARQARGVDGGAT